MTEPNDPLPDTIPDEGPDEKGEKTLATGTMSEPAILTTVEPEPIAAPEPMPSTEVLESVPDVMPPQRPAAETLPESAEEATEKSEGEEEGGTEQETIEHEGGGKRLWITNSGNRRRFRVPSLPAIRPLRTIIVLLIVIFLLLMLIWHFGLGGGGGELLPGNPPTMSSETEPEKEKPVEEERPAVRRELNISFFPSATDPTAARELACNLDWTEQATGSQAERQESRRIATENMTDFEFELERAIRTWRMSLGAGETLDIPVVSVSMTPFPGEGVFRKIESISLRVDPRISILRLETP